MMKVRLLTIALLAALTLAALPAFAANPAPAKNWFDLGALLAANAESSTGESLTTPKPAKAPPLPLHTVEGYGGAMITPMAYLVNPGPKGTVVGLPSAAFTFTRLGTKDLQTVSVTQTFFRRIELGYAFTRFGIGTLDDDIKKALSIDILRHEIYMHNFNVRVLLSEENSFNLPLPAITAGFHFKYNDSIRKIDRRLGGALQGIGLDKSNGVDYTLTATKMFAKLAFGRPVILTGGLRLSKAAQIGLLGFGDECALTFEGSVACLATDWLLLAYEIRQKENPYDKIDGIIGDEDNWHAISATFIVNEHLTLLAAWLYAGNVANARADCSWVLHAKWEF